jgi:hypothetical protein
MFKSRRVPAPPPETVKVAEAVKAYYDAGHRPSPHWEPPAPATSDAAAHDGAAHDGSEPEPASGPEPEPETPPAVMAQSVRRYEPGAIHKTLAELAEELEAFIEVIRYGDNLGSSTARI